MTYLAVFDWNGTLFDDTSATMAGNNACMELFGRPSSDLATVQEHFTFPLVHFYERMGVSVDDYLAKTHEASQRFLDVYGKASRVCGLAVGAIDLLGWLRRHSVHCMILSNHLQSCLDMDVARLGVTPYMAYISGNEEAATVSHGLSKQIRLEAYMKTHGFTSKDAFIIGDSHEEPDLARRLGMLGISITGGMISTKRLAAIGPDHIIDRLGQLRSILEKHWKL